MFNIYIYWNSRFIHLFIVLICMCGISIPASVEAINIAGTSSQTLSDGVYFYNQNGTMPATSADIAAGSVFRISAVYGAGSFTAGVNTRLMAAIYSNERLKQMKIKTGQVAADGSFSETDTFAIDAGIPAGCTMKVLLWTDQQKPLIKKVLLEESIDGYVSSVRSNIILPYNNATAHSLWVSPTGNDNANGKQESPLKTIQAAVKKAVPGTAVMAKQGVYEGSIILDGVNGTPEAPIILVSADGIGEATINGSVDNAAIKGYRLSNVGIYGFHINANVPAGSGDIGGVKLFGTFDNPAVNLVFAGNLITGIGNDGFKLFGGANNCIVVGNTFDGTWEQEAMDYVSVENVTVAYNTVGGRAEYTGITMKHGSRNMEVFNNLFNLTAGRGINIGGQGSSPWQMGFPAYWMQFEAQNIHVHHNVVNYSAGGGSAYFEGASKCNLEYNYLARAVGSIYSTQSGHYTYNSFDNKILYNKVSASDFFQPATGQTEGYVVENNIISSIKPEAGADIPQVQRFLSTIMGL